MLMVGSQTEAILNNACRTTEPQLQREVPHAYLNSAVDFLDVVDIEGRSM